MTQYFIPGCICKGFNTYDEAWNFLLGADAQPSVDQQTTVPMEPPEVTIPPEPSVVHDHTSEATNDDDLSTDSTHDYNIILKRKSSNLQNSRSVPTKVDINDDTLTTNDQTYSTESSILPFLSMGPIKPFQSIQDVLRMTSMNLFSNSSHSLNIPPSITATLINRLIPPTSHSLKT